MSGEAQSTGASSEILFLAKQFLAGQLGVIETARALSPLRHYANSEVSEVLLAFTVIDSETDCLPLGKVRQHWTAEALERKDREFVEAEDFYRSTAIDAATRLVHLLEPTH
jgi:hypothetical protein